MVGKRHGPASDGYGANIKNVYRQYMPLVKSPYDGHGI